MTRVLVIGSSGQLARSLVEAGGGGDLTVIAIGRPEVDLTRRGSAGDAIRRHRPDVVVNTAGFTAVDVAESAEAEARATNAEGAGEVATAAAASGIPLVHISTDYVFDGRKGAPYVEDDPTVPLNGYGRSKLAGEKLVRAAAPRHTILRTAGLYGPFGTNFVTRILDLARARDVIRVVDDQQGSPTYAPDLADAVLAVARALIAADDPAHRGVFHAAGRTPATWYDLARGVLGEAERQGIGGGRIEPIRTADFNAPAPRPADARLDCARLDRTFGVSLAGWRERLGACIKRIGEATGDRGAR